MYLCGLLDIFKKRKNININLKESLHIHDQSDIILKELNDKVDIAELNYKNHNSTDNMLKCINAVNMRNKYIHNCNNKDTYLENEDIDLT